MNNPTTAQIALAARAIEALGEQAGPEPVAQLQQLAADEGRRLDATELADLTGRDGIAAYGKLLDRQETALRALARIHIAHVRGDVLQVAADRLDADPDGGA